jgi:hypothetical protein
VRQCNVAHFAGKEPQSGTKKGAAVQWLGVGRRLLYVWRDRFDETDPPPQRSRELILRKQILKLKRLLANKILEVDFFRRALQRVGARRPRRNSLGDGASTKEYEERCHCKVT